eukprot:Protomagalhaensia_sp_Gyna_25__5589@NODE_76_length_5570_cov_17_836738_g57_i0_p6_GENE_NODE_76_length_5570_cov_17_836738_g57_i0NODE_76_length_5570_cov_17_836738_g57_i0_p6_ORF_typecomplete_len174_score21_56XRCC4/PF06632_12/7_4e06LIF_OSM/PF01291_17/0_24LIF_OSM/PF01291_17/2_4e03_NODE_76_length_5570_cov_17_836738_g57_i0175696
MLYSIRTLQDSCLNVVAEYQKVSAAAKQNRQDFLSRVMALLNAKKRRIAELEHKLGNPMKPDSLETEVPPIEGAIKPGTPTVNPRAKPKAKSKAKAKAKAKAKSRSRVPAIHSDSDSGESANPASPVVEPDVPTTTQVDSILQRQDEVSKRKTRRDSSVNLFEGWGVSSSGEE